ncbi:hypothetical protein PR048_031309 [Dryococelus australis]|uniref:Uncharacterized protein n=1 Tax=Dryococelus australis TaxID=614101 RepID=A0ABQ9G7S4_9NEOP|nr:hypothetical protein PR048_031309 [Dryococelus australis]
MRVFGVSVEQRRNEGAGKREIPDKTRRPTASNTKCGLKTKPPFNWSGQFECLKLRSGLTLLAQIRNYVLVPLIWACPFSDWLHEALGGTGFVSDWPLYAARFFLLAVEQAIDSELQCRTVSPEFIIIIGFSGLPPTMGADVKTRMSVDGTPPSLDVSLEQCLDDKDLVRPNSTHRARRGPITNSYVINTRGGGEKCVRSHEDQGRRSRWCGSEQRGQGSRQRRRSLSVQGARTSANIRTPTPLPPYKLAIGSHRRQPANGLRVQHIPQPRVLVHRPNSICTPSCSLLPKAPVYTTGRQPGHRSVYKTQNPNTEPELQSVNNQRNSPRTTKHVGPANQVNLEVIPTILRTNSNHGERRGPITNSYVTNTRGGGEKCVRSHEVQERHSRWCGREQCPRVQAAAAKPECPGCDTLRQDCILLTCAASHSRTGASSRQDYSRGWHVVVQEFACHSRVVTKRHVRKSRPRWMSWGSGSAPSSPSTSSLTSGFLPPVMC